MISRRAIVTEEIGVGIPMVMEIVVERGEVGVREFVIYSRKEIALEEIHVGFRMKKKNLVSTRGRHLTVELKLALTF